MATFTLYTPNVRSAFCVLLIKVCGYLLLLRITPFCFADLGIITVETRPPKSYGLRALVSSSLAGEPARLKEKRGENKGKVTAQIFPIFPHVEKYRGFLQNAHLLSPKKLSLPRRLSARCLLPSLRS